MILYSLVFGIVAIFAGCLLLPTPDVLSGNGAYLPTAYLYMTLCSIGFFLGYLFFSGSRPAAQEECDSNGSRSNRYLQAKHMAILTLVACSGVAVLLLQINSTVGLAEYLNLIRSAQSSDDTNHIRYLTVALGSGDGGLPGYIKVFSENFVVAPLCLLALIARGYKVRHIGNYLLGILIGVLFLFGTLLRMDRLSFLALIPVGISIFVRSKNRAAKIASVGCALSLLLMIVVQSMRRGDGMGMTEWAALYLQLGMVNLGVMIKTNPAFTYGFAGVFSFATLILSVFGVHLLSGTEIYDSIWSPAQNAFGYMFQDFGWFGILFFFIAGIAGRRVDLRAKLPSVMGEHNPWMEIQWIFSFAILSIPVVPAYAGLEYWLLMFGSIFVVRFLIRDIHPDTQEPNASSSIQSPASADSTG